MSFLMLVVLLPRMCQCFAVFSFHFYFWCFFFVLFSPNYKCHVVSSRQQRDTLLILVFSFSRLLFQYTEMIHHHLSHKTVEFCCVYSHHTYENGNAKKKLKPKNMETLWINAATYTRSALPFFVRIWTQSNVWWTQTKNVTHWTLIYIWYKVCNLMCFYYDKHPITSPPLLSSSIT